MSNAERLARALDIVEANLHGDIGVGDMADAACLSPFYFSRVFSAAFLVGPWEWIVRRRLAEAAKALAAGAIDSTDASYEYGFSGPDVFARSMRRAYGVLPSDLRKGTKPKRPFLERPDSTIVSMCGDASRVPKVAVFEIDGKTLRGETLFAGKPWQDGLDDWIIEALNLPDAGSILVQQGTLGQTVVCVASESGFGTKSCSLTLERGKWLVCTIPERNDFHVARAWFHAVALSVLPVMAERYPEIIEAGKQPDSTHKIMMKIFS